MNTGGILAALQPKLPHYKRTSKRRWKARCRAGREIPYIAIVEHQLERWFTFDPTEDLNRDVYRALPRI